MGPETYEALKRIIKDYEEKTPAHAKKEKDVRKVKDWVDEVAKEYDE